MKRTEISVEMAERAYKAYEIQDLLDRISNTRKEIEFQRQCLSRYESALKVKGYSFMIEVFGETALNLDIAKLEREVSLILKDHKIGILGDLRKV